MKLYASLGLAVLTLCGCASMSPAPAATQTASVAPCHEYQSNGREAATQAFGSCLAMADGLAAGRKPTAATPEATHWDMPVMQGFMDGTAHATTGTDGG